jgi:ferritin
MVLEIMPKLIITHMVEMANERKHISILAIRRLVNFIRLFRLAIEIVPGVQTEINNKLREFKEQEAKRVKDFTPSLGDILAISMVSNEFTMFDILEHYLEEQLDRQAFWIIR